MHVDSYIATARPEQDEQERLSEVGDTHRGNEAGGNSGGQLFDGWRFHFRLWWEARQREQKSAAGKKGQEVKQAKQAASEPKQARKKKSRFLKKVLGGFFAVVCLKAPALRVGILLPGTPLFRRILLKPPFASGGEAVCDDVCQKRMTS